MNALIKYLMHLATLLFAVIAIALIAQNMDQAVDIQLFNRGWEQVSLGLTYLIALVSGLIICFSLVWPRVARLQAEAKHYELRKEKAEVKAESSSDQIRVLESKIQTLEKALEQALSTK